MSFWDRPVENQKSQFALTKIGVLIRAISLLIGAIGLLFAYLEFVEPDESQEEINELVFFQSTTLLNDSNVRKRVKGLLNLGQLRNSHPNYRDRIDTVTGNGLNLKGGEFRGGSLSKMALARANLRNANLQGTNTLYNNYITVQLSCLEPCLMQTT